MSIWHIRRSACSLIRSNQKRFADKLCRPLFYGAFRPKKNPLVVPEIKMCRCNKTGRTELSVLLNLQKSPKKRHKIVEKMNIVNRMAAYLPEKIVEGAIPMVM